MLVLKQLIDRLSVERYLFVHCKKNLSAEVADLFYKCNTVLLSRATQRLEYQTI